MINNAMLVSLLIGLIMFVAYDINKWDNLEEYVEKHRQPIKLSLIVMIGTYIAMSKHERPRMSPRSVMQQPFYELFANRV